MDTISDRSWLLQAPLGTIERFQLRGYSVLALSIHGDSHHGNGACRYRLLFFASGVEQPAYAINLERSIMEEWMITEQRGNATHIVRHLSAEISYETFRIQAMERALVVLDQS